MPLESTEKKTILAVDDKLENLKIDNKVTLLDYIMGGLDINVHVAIDCTLSNGDPKSEDSLHFIGNESENQYINAI